jgi:hypothetical protein
MAVVNSPPTVALLESGIRELSALSGEDVYLPVSVSDSDKDPLKVLCVFDQGAKVTDMAHSGGDGIAIPASELEGLLTPGKHSVTVYGWDGYDLSEEGVTVDYVVNENGAESEVGELVAEAMAEIVVAGVVLLAIVFTRKARKDSSSTGLLEGK